MDFSKTGKTKNKGILKFFLFYILLNLPLYGFSFSSRHFSSPINTIKPQSWKFAKGVLKTDSIEKEVQSSVWQIRNSRIAGTAFPIGPKLFVTNFHIMDSLLNDSFIKDIVLQQKGSSSRLNIRGVRQVSALYDLVLFEIEERVNNYLTIKESVFQPHGDLFILGYPKGKFKKMKKTGKITEEDQQYIFSVNNSFLKGASGGPVLDAKRWVVGVLSIVYGNISFAIKSKHLSEMIMGDDNLDCSDFISPVACIEEEIENLETVAKQGNAYAQYRLARYYEGKEINQDLALAFYWMEQSAIQGYMYAQNHLGNMYYNGRGVTKDLDQAFYWYKRSAEQGYFLAQSNLANMYYQGKGIKRDKEMAFYWKKRSAKQGYATAQKDLVGMFYLGEGTKKNLQSVSYWLQEFAKQEGYTQKRKPYNTYPYNTLLR